MAENERPDGDKDLTPETKRAVSQQAKQKPQDEPGKPNEGTRPQDLTSENDGGGEG